MARGSRGVAARPHPRNRSDGGSTWCVGRYSRCCFAAPVLGAAQAPPAGASEPFVVEYYYKARWGFADEFIRLFKKNQLPGVEAGDRAGHIQRVTAEAPRFHGPRTAAGTIASRSCGRTRRRRTSLFPEAELKRLFPDQDTFRREEQRRFEILAAHWDLPVVTVDLTRP